MTDNNAINWPRTRELYPFQREAVERIVERGFGFIWDDPGLGKTTQAIVAARSLGGRWLVVCPKRLKRWWRKEIIQLYPEDQSEIVLAGVAGRFQDPTARTRQEIAPHYYERKKGFPRWTITHYTGVRISEAGYGQVNWDGVITDECHFIKNRNAQRTKAVQKITPEVAFRIGLTATPFGTNPADLWSQLRWMAPHHEGTRSYWRWFNLFVDYEWEHNEFTGARYRKIKGGKHLEMLSEVMHHWGLQRTKKQVARDLPPLTHTPMPLDFDGRQELIYDAFTDKYRVELVIRHTERPEGSEAPGPEPANAFAAKVAEIKRQKAAEQGEGFTKVLIKNTLARMTRTEQWLSHPWTFEPGVVGSKMEWLKDWADGYDYPAVIVTRFRASSERIVKELGDRAERAVLGGVPEAVADDVANNWRNGDFQFLVGTIGTLGVGLNLQHAHAMVCYDQVWSPIQMEQVYQRIHRIDSDHPVEAIYLYIEDTTNELIFRSFREKWSQMQLVKEYLRLLQGRDNNDSRT